MKGHVRYLVMYSAANGNKALRQLPDVLELEGFPEREPVTR
jgi:hypothetical protein